MCIRDRATYSAHGRYHIPDSSTSSSVVLAVSVDKLLQRHPEWGDDTCHAQIEVHVGWENLPPVTPTASPGRRDADSRHAGLCFDCCYGRHQGCYVVMTTAVVVVCSRKNVNWRPQAVAAALVKRTKAANGYPPSVAPNSGQSDR